LLYLLGLGGFGLSQLRLLTDHHLNSDGRLLDWESHILDSCNYTGRDPLTWLLFPFSAVSLLHSLPRSAPPVPIAAVPQPGRGPSAPAAALAYGVPLSVARSGFVVERRQPTAPTTFAAG
jgi:hypothetical protein